VGVGEEGIALAAMRLFTRTTVGDGVGVGTKKPENVGEMAMLVGPTTGINVGNPFKDGRSSI